MPKHTLLKIKSGMQRSAQIERKIKVIFLKKNKREDKKKLIRMLQRVRSYSENLKRQFKSLNSDNQNLSECTDQLSEIKSSRIKPYNPWRKFTEAENKVDFIFLNESFNTLETTLEKQLIDIISNDLPRGLKRIDNKIKTGDLAGIASISVLSINKIAKAIKEANKESFERGKKSASDEIDVKRPSTPNINTQIMNFEGNQFADEFVSQVNGQIQETVKEGFSKELSAAAIMAAAALAARDRSSKLVNQTTGTVVGQNINRGRRLVFEDNINQIKSFQRSEIIDRRTCNICLSLDQRIISPDDPMATLDLVHTNCRGQWIPITIEEPIPEKAQPVTPTIRKRFDTIGGAPTINNFKQLKKPFNTSNPNANKEIQRRIEKNTSR